MNISISPYILKSFKALNRTGLVQREGFLLRVSDEGYEAGYADCCPLAMFGDLIVSEQIQRLRSGHVTPLLERSLFFARIDGLAREKKQTLFSEASVRSHYTCVDINELTPDRMAELSANGFRTVKIKVAKDLISFQKMFLQVLGDCSKIRWRLDFNGTGGAEFLNMLPVESYNKIDLVEDPIPFNFEKWAELEEKTGIPLAADQFPQEYRRRVIKPARDSFVYNSGDIITNSMDHPVGQSFAFWYAQQNPTANETEHGLCTSHLFESDPFNLEIKTESCFFQPSDGYGVGFNDLLRKRDWVDL